MLNSQSYTCLCIFMRDHYFYVSLSKKILFVCLKNTFHIFVLNIVIEPIEALINKVLNIQVYNINVQSFEFLISFNFVNIFDNIIEWNHLQMIQLFNNSS